MHAWLVFGPATTVGGTNMPGAAVGAARAGDAPHVVAGCWLAAAGCAPHGAARGWLPALGAAAAADGGGSAVVTGAARDCRDAEPDSSSSAKAKIGEGVFVSNCRDANNSSSAETTEGG